MSTPLSTLVNIRMIRRLVVGMTAVLLALPAGAPASAALPAGAPASAALPAGAAGPFGPRVRVIDPGCDVETAYGDAVVGADGVTRGFVRFSGDDCPQRIYWFEGSGSSWTSERTRYRGIVLAAAYDGTGSRLLFANAGGVKVARRTPAGVERDPVRVDRKGLGGAQFPSGDLVVGGGRWLAVWSRQVGPGGEFAQTELFSAQSMGRGHCFSRGINRQRVTRSNRNDDNPTLLGPDLVDGKARLVWERNDGAQGLVSNLRSGRMRLDDCRWRQRVFTRGGDLNLTPDATRGLEARLLTWQRDGHILVDGGSAFGRRRLGRGFGPDISHTAATTHVAWNTFNAPSRIRLAERVAGSGWTVHSVTPGAANDQQLLGVTGAGGKATVLAVNLGSGRLYARIQS